MRATISGGLSCGGVVERAYRGYLAAAIDIAVDNCGGCGRSLRDVHRSVLHQAELLALGPLTVEVNALTAAEHIANTVCTGAQLREVADGAARNVNGDVAVCGRTCSVWVVTFCYQLAIVSSSLCSEIGAYSSHTSAAEDGAEYLGILRDVDAYVAADSTCREGQGGETTSAAEDVAIDAGGTECADESIALDSGADIAQDVTILTAAKDAAEDDGYTVHDDFGRSYIGPSVEQNARVAHTGAKDVAVDGTCLNASNGTWNTDRTGLHHNLTLAKHIGNLVTAIDVGKDVSASDFYQGVADYAACRTTPQTRTVRIVAATAAKDVAVVAMTVTAWLAASLRIISRCPMIVVIHITAPFSTERPCIALMERRNGCVDISYNAGLDGIDGSSPLGICIGRIPVVNITIVLVVARTYLAALDLHMSIAQHLSVLRAAIDRSGNKSATDLQM